MQYTSLVAIQTDLWNGQLTCRNLVTYYLQNVTEKNPQLHAFLEVYDQEALQRADEIDVKIKNGTAGKLAGMVLGIKDLLCYKDHHSSAGSRILEGFVSQFSATAVQRVLDEDAIIIGRQNCDEFGMGSSNENSGYTPTYNAIGENRVPGGSSGGSAVAVQADMCLASLGTDTGGSIRQPAAFCGVVGLKPTYSRVSRWGLIAYASSFDTIGPITKCVADAGILLEVISGKDEFDSTVFQGDRRWETGDGRRETGEELSMSNSQFPVLNSQFPNSPLETQNSKLKKIAYIKEAVESDSLQSEIKEATLAKLEWLKTQGYEVEAVDFPLMKHLLPTYYILTTAEASSNLARFDGVKYGYRSPLSIDLMTMYKKSRSEAFGKEVKRRIMLGTFVLSASYYDAYYTKAQKIRRLVKEFTDELLTRYDFLVCPTTPTTAYRIGEKTTDPIQMFLGDLFTVQANVVGLPAISVPNGVDKEGLPIGFQAMAGAFQEEALIAFGKLLEAGNTQ